MNERAKDFAATCHRSGCDCSVCMPIRDFKTSTYGHMWPRSMADHADVQYAGDLMRMPTSELIDLNGQAYSTDCFREYQRRLALEA